jgi:ribosome recycling factor
MDTKTLEENIAKAKEWLKTELSQLSTGQANPAILDSVQVESYGTRQPIKNIAAVTTEDPKTLRISPWDKSQIKDIERAIHTAKLPISLSTDDQGIRVHVPALTQESRVAIAKLLKEKLEQARIRVRSAREETLGLLKEAGLSEDDTKGLKDSIQKMVDTANDHLQGMFSSKETEVTTL